MSERISGVESTATQRISASGAITSSGLAITACGSTPKATASTSALAIATPAATPRIEKRELSVMTGIASHESAITRGPPSSATAPAIVSSLPIHAPNINSSGRATRGISASAALKNADAGIRNSSGHQPSHGATDAIATARIANARRRTGRTRSSMSSMRSRSKSSRHSHEACELRSTTGGGACVLICTYPLGRSRSDDNRRRERWTHVEQRCLSSPRSVGIPIRMIPHAARNLL